MRPIMIAIEGLDGSGKTTQINLLANALSNQGIKASVFRYSAIRDDFIGKIIKHLYTSDQNGVSRIRLLPKVRLIQELLFGLQAHLNYKELGKPNLYKVILLDRCAVTAFIAHTDQAGMLLIPEKIISVLEATFVPDYVIYLSIQPQLAMSRITQRSGKNRSDEHLEKIATMELNYHRIMNGNWQPKALKKIRKWSQIDANAPVEVIHQQLIGLVWEILRAENNLDEKV